MDQQTAIEKKKFFHSLVFPVFFTLIIWLVWITSYLLDMDMSQLGIYPRKWESLTGVLTVPLAHGDFWHLFNNTYSFLVLSWITFYFYRPIAYRVFFIIYLFSGLGIWLIGREAFHVGASGIIYGLAFFVFMSGIIRRHIGLMALSLIVIFLYGSMVWYLFPIKESISWEGHSAGAVTGIILSVIYRHHGPRRKVYEWEEEDVDEEEAWDYRDSQET